MTKILVDFMPKKSDECPFAECIDMISNHKCGLQSGLYSRCNIECGEKCDKLRAPLTFVEESEVDIVYFELNNWFAGRDYPNNERFIKWMHDDLNIRFRDENWIEENKLCVVTALVDMSQNFCVTATKEWVMNNCPELLTEFTEFLREPDEYGDVFGRFNHEFLPYEEENIGITYVEEEDW